MLVGEPEWKNHLRDRGEDGRMIMGLRETKCVVVDWIQRAQDMVQWRDLVKTVMKLQVP
jgi:hypothetical protein